MVSQRQAIEAALIGWRAAERKLAGANGHTDAIQAEIDRHRGEFQRLSADHMIGRIDALKDAEHRRASAVPSTHPFHQAAQDEKAIADEIWESARESDEDTPQTRSLKLTRPETPSADPSAVQLSRGRHTAETITDTDGAA